MQKIEDYTGANELQAAQLVHPFKELIRERHCRQLAFEEGSGRQEDIKRRKREEGMSAWSRVERWGQTQNQAEGYKNTSSDAMEERMGEMEKKKRCDQKGYELSKFTAGSLH